MRIINLIVTILAAMGCLAAEGRAKTAQVELAGFPLEPPVLVLNTDNQLVFSFDIFAEDRDYLRYELIHCNSDWTPSDLVDSEYLDGFNQADIDMYDYSQLTTTHYVHYQFAIPNAQMTPLLSGNYKARVYPEDNPDATVTEYRFYVSEQTAQIDVSYSSRTDVDVNKGHQQLELSVDVERSHVQDPFNDLEIVILQNGRQDNKAELRQPLRMANRSTAVYAHQQPLIFEAGNEYRRMECVSVKYPSMGVEEIEYYEPYYHVKLHVDNPRSDEMYLYDQTQHGRYFVREYDSGQSEIEADYVVVHFRLDMGGRVDDEIYLDGDFTDRNLDANAMMVYNPSTGLYERNMLLKQGAYNYQYLSKKAGERIAHASQIEGDKYQTQNEYLVLVYARHLGERYDRLIGTTLVK